MAGDWDEAVRLADRAGTTAQDNAGVWASNEHLRALLALSRGDAAAASARLASALTALDQVPPDAPPFFTVCSLAYSVDSLDGLLCPVFEETMLPGRRVGSAQGRGYILATEALAARMAGHDDYAGILLDQALRAFQSLADRAGQAHILAQRGHLLRQRRDPGGARECFRSAADLRAAIPDQRGTAIALTGVALAEAALGHGHRARGIGWEACRILDQSGDRPGYHGALNNLAVAEVLAGRPAQAVDAVKRALALRAVPDTHRSVAWQYMLLAGLHEALADRTAATAALAKARARFERIGERPGLAAVMGESRPDVPGRDRRAKRLQSRRP
jgi:tetratricopeptide (TPR) repeat protein